MSLPEYLEVTQAETRADFKRVLGQMMKQKGFDHFTAMTVNMRSGSPVASIVDDVPQDYAVHYYDLGAGQIDPILKHLSSCRVPIVWDQRTYVEAGLGELWELQAPFGYRTGIAMALHMPDGSRFSLGVDRHDPLPKQEDELRLLVADLQLLAVYAQEAAERLLVPRVSGIELPELTKRELEALKWTMDGKTSWEVGQILGIAEGTAVRHLANAQQKLGCVSKHHAVVRAIKLGLITS